MRQAQMTRNERRYYRKKIIEQRLMGLGVLACCALVLWMCSTGVTVEDRDGTAVVLLAPLGLWLLFSICGCSFDEENFEGVVVNEGIDNEYHVCCDCVPSECNNGHIISCEACGSYFSADKLRDEEIEGHSFTACPACGKDVVEGLSRAEFEDEYFRPRYSVVVRQFSGSVRGYIVSANSRHEVMKRLLEKLDFNYVAEVSIGEILVKEDEF